MFCRRLFLVLLISNIFCFDFIAQTDSLSVANGFKYEASYIGDNVGNLSGGIKTGYGYLGMANLRLLFNTHNAGWWRGTQFYVNAANTHGTEPSATMIGDMQVASNIEAGNHTYIQEVWLKQSFNHFELTAGLQDLNMEFAASEYGSIFMNSSFGILPIISANMPAPIFPLTSPGLTAKFYLNEKTSWLLAIYDGSPTDFDYNPYNLKWQFISGDGMLLVTEIQKTTVIKGLEGAYKFGWYSHNHFIEKQFNPEFPDSLNNSILGVYVYADQKIWQTGKKCIGAFLQMGYTPSDKCFNNYYLGMGINYKGIFSKSADDILGLAVGHESLTKDVGEETVIELSYQRQITPNLFVQPDLQYIITPSGKSSNLQNAFVASLRFGLSF